MAIMLMVFAISIPAEDLITNATNTTTVSAGAGTNAVPTGTSVGATNGAVTATATAGTNGTVTVTVTVVLPGGTNVLVTTVTATNAIPKPPAAKPRPIWETSLALGLTLTRGNSEALLFTGKVLAERKGDIYELSLELDGSYGKNQGIKNSETLHGYAQYNQLFDGDLFAYARVEGLHDAIADIDYRLSFSPGVGRYLIKSARTALSVEAGPGVTYERQDRSAQTYCNLRLAEKFEYGSTTT